MFSFQLYWEIIVIYHSISFRHRAWFTYIVKWQPQWFQLTSVFSYRYHKKKKGNNISPCDANSSIYSLNNFPVSHSSVSCTHHVVRYISSTHFLITYLLVYAFFPSPPSFEIFFSTGFLKFPLSVQIPCKKAETLSISEEKKDFTPEYSLFTPIHWINRKSGIFQREGELKECHWNNDIEVREVQLCPHTCALPAYLSALTEPMTAGWVAESSPLSCPQHAGPRCLLASSARRKVTSASL